VTIRSSFEQLAELRKLPKGWNYGQDGPLTSRGHSFAKIALVYLASIGATSFDILPSTSGGATILAKFGDDSAEIIVRSTGLFDAFFDAMPEKDVEAVSFGELVAALESNGTALVFGKDIRVKLIDHAEAAGRARCDLNIFYAVIAILEGGTLTAHADADAQAIIKRCRQASQKALRRYDRHMDAIKSGWEQ